METVVSKFNRALYKSACPHMANMAVALYCNSSTRVAFFLVVECILQDFEMKQSGLSNINWLMLVHIYDEYHVHRHHMID